MSNTIKDLSENKEEIKEINTFHTPSFGDEEFNINPHAQLDMQNSQFDQHHLASHHHHHQQQQQLQEHYNIQTNASQYIIDDSQQNWNTSASESQVYHNQDYWVTPNQDLSYGYNTNEIHQQQQQQIQPQTQSQPHLIQHHHHHQQHQQQLLQQQPQQIHHLQPQQRSQQQLAQQHNVQQSQQMLMMPPPQQSPQMSPQMTNTINYIGQSPQQFCESGTTSDDSDDNNGIPRNPMKRPSPKPVGSGGDELKLNITKMAPIKKPKVQRKKKKKDPNEPQKPVSAYALFFRDTQAAIKGENPNASFGEVSTIVASMWDVLAPEHKDFYKKKTEDAKKDYLKTLAAYRANFVSKGNELENQPHQQELQQKSPTPVYQSPPRSQQSPSSVDNSNRNVITNNVEVSSHMSPSSQTQQQQQLIQSPQIMLGLPIQPNQHMQYMHPQQQQQVQHSSNIYQHYNNTQVYKSPNAHNVDYNNTQAIMQQNMSPPPSQQHIITSPNRNQQINYTSSHHHQSQNLNGNMVINNPIYGNQQQHLQQQHVQSIQQHQHQQQQQQQQQQHEQTQPQIHNNSEHQNQSNTAPNTLQPQKIEHEITNQENVQQCIRQGCTNPAIVHADWDDEFCSNDCVVIHCRTVFTDCIRNRAHEKPPTTVK